MPAATAQPTGQAAALNGAGGTLFLVTSDADAVTIGRAIDSGVFVRGMVLVVAETAEPAEIEGLIASANAFRVRPGLPPLVVDMRVR